MKIFGIESVTYGLKDLEAGIRYFEDWGLRRTARGAKSGDFETLSGQGIRLRDAADAGLPAAAEAGDTVREVVWGTDSDASLQEIAAELGRDRAVRQDSDGVIHTTDESGFGLGFRVASASRSNPAAPPSARVNRPFDPPPRVEPTRIGHVVYNVPRTHADRASSFYLERLGFRLSDRTPDLGDFMRASGSSEHHNLFLLRAGERRGFNHVAFEVAGFDEVVFGGKHMEKAGWTPHSRPGRHWLGSNLFWYFKNPCGGNTEYYADMDRMDDRWQPRIWEKGKYPGFAMWMLE